MPEFTHLDDGVTADDWRDWRAALPRLQAWEGMRRLVVLAAHPDDETLGAGGLMARAAASGVDVELVTVTWGEASHPESPSHTPGQIASLRREEMAEALAVLAPESSHHQLDLPDGRVAGSRDEVEAALARITGEDGDGLWLAAPMAGDGHPDHDVLGEVALTVGARIGAHVLEYPVWHWWWADPAATDTAGWHAVDLDAPSRVAKRRALDAHRSQHEPLSDAPGDEAILQPAFLEHFKGTDEVFRLTAPATEAEHPMEAVHAADDPWGVDRYFYEARKRALTLASLPRKSYRRALEVGCSVGALAADLAPRCEELLAVDLSERAIDAATRRLHGIPGVTAARLRVPGQWPDGRFDLVVVSETGYYLTPEELRQLADRIDACLDADGTVVLCHWLHPIEGWFLQGSDVHDAFAADGRFEVMASHREPDFALDVLQRPGEPSPARREGLV